MTCFLVKPRFEFLFYHILSVTSWQHHYSFWSALSILDWVPPESRAWPRAFMQGFLRNNLRKRVGSNISATGKEIKPFPGGLLESASTVSKQAQWQRELLRAAQNAHGTEEGPVLDGLHHSLPDHARVSAAWFLTSHVQTSCAAVRGSWDSGGD